MVGNLAVTEVHAQGYPSHSSPTYYWQAYQNFGDPSMVAYHTQGEVNTVSHMAILPIGVTTYTVNALPGSYVAISKDGVLHGAALVDATGEVVVPNSPVLSGGNVDIVVTKPQYQPYMASIPAAALEGPYIVLDSYIVNDNLGNNNGQIDYTENVSLTITAKNVGADPSTAITATIDVSDPYVMLSGSNIINFGVIQNGINNTATVAGALTLQITANVPDQYVATLPIAFTDGTHNWTSNLKLTINAPVLSLDANYILIETNGNNNGRLDAGETGTATFKITNNGHAMANNPTALLTGNCAYLTINNPVAAIEPIAVGGFADVNCTLAVHPSCPEGINATLTFQASDPSPVQQDYNLIIGQMPQITIGSGTETPSYFPFYNWYKANRSQMLYLESELCTGDKTITELAFDLAHVSSTANVLTNFKIILKATTATTLTGAFANTSDGTIVFQSAAYEMPSATGWNTWDIEDYELAAGQNLIIEIIWGLIPNYCGSGDFFTVNSTQVSENRVVYGYDDSQASPTYDGSSNKLPNLFLTFEATNVLPEYAVNFTVVSGGATNPVENAQIVIGSQSLITDNTGNASINLVSGDYLYNVLAETFAPIVNQGLTVENENQNILIDLTPLPTYEVSFIVKDEANNPINDAVITFGNQTFNPGVYQISGFHAGTYAYRVDKQNYVSSIGTATIVDNDIVVEVSMNTGFAVNFNVTDGTNALQGAVVSINNLQITTNASGLASINLLAGTYPFSVTKNAYQLYEGAVVISNQAVNMNVNMVLITYLVNINITSGTEAIAGANVQINNQNLVSNEQGNVQISLAPGTYNISVGKEGYQDYSGSVIVTNQPVTHNIELSLLAYQVSFNVACDGTAISGASISIDNQTLTSNAQGTTSISLIPGTYPYVVTKEGYETFNQNLTVENEDIEVDVDLVAIIPTYTVTFVIEDQNGASIDNGIITFNEATYNAGEYVITGVAPGTYDYNVSLEGYSPANGSVTIVDQDITVNLVIIIDAIPSTEKPLISAYPNPTTSEINVSVKGFGQEFKITLMNYQGQVISTQESVGVDAFSLDLKGFASGIYYIKINNNKHTEVLRVVLQ